jgi:hypothetical protein
MSVGSTLDPNSVGVPGAARRRGHDTASLGPGDRSDTGSDGVGETGLDPAILADDGDGDGPIGDVERAAGGAGPGGRYAGDASDDPDAVGGPQDDPDAAREDVPQRGSIERGPRGR